MKLLSMRAWNVLAGMYTCVYRGISAVLFKLFRRGILRV